MALSAGALTILFMISRCMIAQLALYKLEIPGKLPKTEILIVRSGYSSGSGHILLWAIRLALNDLVRLGVRD